MKEFKFNLGDEVGDIITNFRGIVTARSQWQNGCNTYGIQAQSLKDGIPQEKVWFDEPQLKCTQTNKIVINNTEAPGGPCHAIKQPNR